MELKDGSKPGTAAAGGALESTGKPPARKAPSRKKQKAKAGSKVKDLGLAAAEAAPPEAGLFWNRELSLLAFQRRVLEEAQDPGNPLLERVKFLAIVASNLDEFYMVRVGGLRQQIDAGVVEYPPDGMPPAETLAAIRREAQDLMVQSRNCLYRDLIPRLNEAGIQILDYKNLNEKQRANVDDFFREMVFPVLTPLAFDPGRPFPHISNLSLNLAVVIRDEDGEERFARLKVPTTLPRLVPVKRSSGGTRRDGTSPREHQFVWIEQVIIAHLGTLFPGMTIVEAHPFHVTRNADTLIQELEASDLLETIEDSVKRRRFGTVVRLKVSSLIPQHIRDLLVENLQVDPKDVYALEDPLGLSSLMALHGLDRHDLKESPFLPALPAAFEPRPAEEDNNIFAVIRRNDVLLHHPYESFKPVIDFLRVAARDPDVLAIKMTLYRVGRNSPVVQALLDARENGKQVAVLVELKARFDEESNIGWARALEAEGVHVIYGLLGLKTHSKITLVIRREGRRLRRYIHLSTGNYNAVTANLYTDLGYFTCDEDVGEDATHLFNYLTGYSTKRDYRKLLVAPINLRERLEALIDREIAHQQAGREARLIFKINSLVDRGFIRQLYRAAQAGVQVDLIVRGICCLRPGLPGISDKIRVTSIVGRFLEHSRVFYFRNGGQEEILLGSADLMPRNINRRVEVLFPVLDPRLTGLLRQEVLATYLADNVKVRLLKPDGSYERLQPAPGQRPVNAQAELLRRATSSRR